MFRGWIPYIGVSFLIGFISGLIMPSLWSSIVLALVLIWFSWYVVYEDRLNKK